MCGGRGSCCCRPRGLARWRSCVRSANPSARFGGGGNGSSPKAWVRRRRRGFVAEGVDGLLRDRPRSGRPPMVGPDQVRAVGERTVPPDATHWSTRSLARAVGLGKTTIQKIWREHGLKPHLIKGFKVSREPAF